MLALSDGVRVLPPHAFGVCSQVHYNNQQQLSGIISRLGFGLLRLRVGGGLGLRFRMRVSG